MDDELARIREKKLREIEERVRTSREEPTPAAGVTSVDEGNFQDVLMKNSPLVVDFWAEWCGPCRNVGPVIEDLAREFSGRITFVKCNIDNNQRLATQFGITAIPSIFLFRNGRIVDRVVGAYPRQPLRDRIVKAFGIT